MSQVLLLSRSLNVVMGMGDLRVYGGNLHEFHFTSCFQLFSNLGFIPAEPQNNLTLFNLDLWNIFIESYG